MSPFEWLLLAGGAGAIAAYLLWWYRSREEPVRGRVWPALIRGAALLLAWLILLNPEVPVARQAPERRDAVLLDASYSMSRPVGGDGPSTWQAALDSLPGSGYIWLFGGTVPRLARVDSLPDEPFYGESRLTPAVRAAAAAGARRALVYTDARLADVDASLDEARRLGLSLSFVTVGSGYPELGISAVSAPSSIQVGDTAVVRVEVVAAGAGADSVRLDVLDDRGRVRATGRVETPDAGRFAPLRLAFPVAGSPGVRRYTVRIAEPSDPEVRDNRRAFYLRVGERPSGPVLISLLPDWEPSFLIPNLDRLTDTPAAAYLWLADSLVTLEDYRAVSVARVERRARDAPLLVLHGYGADAPPWAQTLARDAQRLLVLPTGAMAFDLPGWGVRVGFPDEGEWYVSREVPRSPLALDLSGHHVEELPPLVRLRSVEAERSWAPLDVRRFRRGEPEPAIVAGTMGSRRWAVAGAEGFWRWAFRRGAGRQLYRTLWTGLAGWLVTGRASAGPGLEPTRRAVERGEALAWAVPGRADSLVVDISDVDSALVWSGAAGPADTLSVWLPPGRYSYRARAHTGEQVTAAAGPVEVEEFTRELLPTPTALVEPAELTVAGDREVGRRGLATLGWPYLVLIVLFCAEWAVRRLIGLR
ncbi:MAG: hypothetical protein PVG79_11910 [Gemmatimonadales bacterium]